MRPLTVAATVIAMAPAIWRKTEDDWKPLVAAGFPSESALHDLVEVTPNMLPLSGDPTLTVLGREVPVASGSAYADLVAVDMDGRLTVIEIKLRKNAEAKPAIVAQLLTYAAYLKTFGLPQLESLLRPFLVKYGDAVSIADAVGRADQTGSFDATEFNEALSSSLADGAFRLVLVLDAAPAELVQLVGYLESIAPGVVIDLVTVAAFQVGQEEILVPQRVDPAYQVEIAQAPAPSRSTQRRRHTPKREVDGSEPSRKQSVGLPSAIGMTFGDYLLGHVRLRRSSWLNYAPS